MGRDDRIYEEAAALWRQLYGEAPPDGDGADMLAWIVGRLPSQSYDRIATPHLRPTDVTFPRR